MIIRVTAEKGADIKVHIRVTRRQKIKKDALKASLVVSDLEERRVRAGIAHYLFHSRLVCKGDEAVGFAALAGAGGPADPVKVKLVVGRDVVVKDCFDIINVDTAGYDVGSNEDLELLVPEGVHHPVARALAHVALKAAALKACGLQSSVYGLGLALCIAEDDGLVEVLFLDKADDRESLVFLRNLDHVLVDVRAIFGLRHNVDLFGALHERPCDVEDFTRHGCGKERDLLVAGSDPHDLLNALDKAHLEHLVCLVEDESVDLADVDYAALV